ncbi:MAG: 2-amino-4-hydroxy-6-hydroxymethyldihydropteridine diphosphokinase [Chloroflexi bacterium]|nr:2-amino-4-hydroxy-6-hydroxymethyldihydropteridine diphosphokinase [Chloroflexota bacterium]
MSDSHTVFLSLGSNVQPEIYLPKAIDLLRNYGKMLAISNVWESHAVGINAANFLNACVLFATSSAPENLKERVIRPIEAKLVRVRVSAGMRASSINDFWDFTQKCVRLGFCVIACKR